MTSARVAARVAAVPGRDLSPASVLALQSAAGNRATARYLHRAIVAIDGDGDTDAMKRAKHACLWNLRHTKKGKGFKDGGARGALEGPAKRAALKDDMSKLLASDDESIYVLAHGSRYSSDIAGMNPTQLAAWLRARCSKRPRFTGKIKLVSCHSGAGPAQRAGG